MDAHKALITDIFNNSTLIEVPFFQRSYVWKEDLWSRLLEDMEYVMKTRRSHFLGSIILKAGRDPKPGEKFTSCRTIVDGQQRLTTFLIFLKVLCMKQGQTLFFDHQFRIMGQMIALHHGKNDVEAFEKIMEVEKPVVQSNPAPESRVIEAYNYFVNNIDATKLDIMTIIMNDLYYEDIKNGQSSAMVYIVYVLDSDSDNIPIQTIESNKTWDVDIELDVLDELIEESERDNSFLPSSKEEYFDATERMEEIRMEHHRSIQKDEDKEGFERIVQMTGIREQKSAMIGGFECHFCFAKMSDDEYIIVYQKETRISDIIDKEDEWKQFQHRLWRIHGSPLQ